MAGNRTPTQADAAIGAKVRHLRMMRGLSQSALADAVGISFQQIQKYEVGTNRIGGSRLLAVAEALRVSVSDIIGTASETAEAVPTFDSPTRDVVQIMMAAPPEIRSAIRDVVRATAFAADMLRAELEKLPKVG